MAGHPKSEYLAAFKNEYFLRFLVDLNYVFKETVEFIECSRGFAESTWGGEEQRLWLERCRSQVGRSSWLLNAGASGVAGRRGVSCLKNMEFQSRPG